MAQDMSFDMSWALVVVVAVGRGGDWWLSVGLLTTCRHRY